MTLKSKTPTTSKAIVPRAPTNSALIKQAGISVEQAFKNIAHILSKDPSPAVIAECHHFLQKEWMKVADDIKKVTRESLITLIEDKGESPDRPDVKELTLTHGTLRLRAQVARYKRKAPDNNATVQLCETKGLHLNVLTDEEVKITRIANVAKIGEAMTAGKITEQEVDSLYSEMPAQLKVEKL